MFHYIHALLQFLLPSQIFIEYLGYYNIAGMEELPTPIDSDLGAEAPIGKKIRKRQKRICAQIREQVLTVFYYLNCKSFFI